MIDMRSTIAVLSSADGDYHKTTEKLIDWYGGGANDCGVYIEREEIVLARSGRTHWTAGLAQTPRGLWLAGYRYDWAEGGGGGPASVWSHFAYENREEAITGERQCAAARFQKLVDNTSISEAARRQARTVVGMLAAAPASEQLSLFGDAA